MSALTICDKCECEIEDGVEIIADFLSIPRQRNREVIDYCTPCAEKCIMYLVKAPGFVKMLCTKIGIHFRSDDE